MAVLQSTNVQGALCVNGVAVGGGKDFKYCCFTASTTWTPSQDLVDGGGNISTIWVAGGGGGGAHCSFGGQQYSLNCSCAIAGAGAGGEAVNDFVTITATDACTITIGAGGQSGSVTDAGTATNSQKGGNTEAFGKTVYGGGGGMTRVCSFCCGCSICCDDNIVGGAVGGCGCMNCNLGGLYNVCEFWLPLNGGTLGNMTLANVTPLSGYCQCRQRVSSHSTCFVSSSEGIVYASNSNGVSTPTTVMGFGAAGQNCTSPQTHKSCGAGGCASAKSLRGYCTGSAGVDGIVVLTWEE